MPWYRSGTVSCTQNSATVTGSGTAFAANTRVGDAFRGPDGNWYEVANVASDTVLSILPPYQGASVATGTYSLAPMQGYLKDSADALRGLVNKFGTLASAPSINALSTLAGAAGSIPYFTAADQMALTKLTTSATDSTVGRILKVGDFGLGSSGPSVSDCNSITATGEYLTQSTTTNVPYGQGTADGQGYLFHEQHSNSAYAAQTWRALNYVWEYHRTRVAGTWSAWTRVVSQALMLGSVSQSGGAPTGAIVETNTTANGTYTKLLDGTLICRGNSSSAYTTATAINSSLYVTSNGISFTFPAAFVVVPSVVPLSITASTHFVWAVTEGAASTNGFGMRLMSAVSNASSYAGYIATGRWF